ncbi:hypothetical protein BT93_E2895 [Corymbia citriodora subsp. variegata]|nr:hypothetical protein BT93_E2895 [Corymbia citriodora subsp. variegata]
MIFFAGNRGVQTLKKGHSAMQQSSSSSRNALKTLALSITLPLPRASETTSPIPSFLLARSVIPFLPIQSSSSSSPSSLSSCRSSLFLSFIRLIPDDASSAFSSTVSFSARPSASPKASPAICFWHIAFPQSPADRCWVPSPLLLCLRLFPMRRLIASLRRTRCNTSPCPIASRAPSTSPVAAGSRDLSASPRTASKAEVDCVPPTTSPSHLPCPQFS